MVRKNLNRRFEHKRILTITSKSFIMLSCFFLVVAGCLNFTVSSRLFEHQELTVSRNAAYSAGGILLGLQSSDVLNRGDDPVGDDPSVRIGDIDEKSDDVLNNLYDAAKDGADYLNDYSQEQMNSIPEYMDQVQEGVKKAFNVEPDPTAEPEAVAEENEEVTQQDEQAVSVSAEVEEVPQAAYVTEDGGTVVFNHSQNHSGLTRNFIRDFYSVSPSERKGFVEEITDPDLFDMLNQKVSDLSEESERYGLHIEKISVKAVLNQRDELLPRIWYITHEGRTLVSPGELTWTSSDENVIAINGVPVIAGPGIAGITGESEELGTIQFVIAVSNEGDVTDFKTESDTPYYLEDNDEESFLSIGHTLAWPTSVDEEGSVTIKGNRIYQCGSQYYLASEDFEADWEDVAGNAVNYLGYLIPLSQGLEFREGESLNGIVPGSVYRSGTNYWIYTGNGEPVSPFEDESQWYDLADLEDSEDEYDPGADTGPGSDAPFYFESQYNPYPGTVSSNCTYAVWALANQALGVRLPNWGDAGNWYRRAGISGYETGQTPAPNSIIVWDHHVGYVTEVSEDGTMIYIKEGNFGGRYHEGWWPVSSSRHGMKTYGYIYLTDETGSAVITDMVFVEDGYHDSEEGFLATLAELGLEPGIRTEAYSDDIPEGCIISYTIGEMPVGSVVDYVVSLGEEPPIEVQVTQQFVGHAEEELLAWFAENGLDAGDIVFEEVDDDQEGKVIGIDEGVYRPGEKVSYRIGKKRKVVQEETTVPSEEPIEEETSEPAEIPEALPAETQTTEQSAETENTDTSEEVSEQDVSQELQSVSGEDSAAIEQAETAESTAEPTETADVQ